MVTIHGYKPQHIHIYVQYGEYSKTITSSHLFLIRTLVPSISDALKRQEKVRYLFLNVMVAESGDIFELLLHPFSGSESFVPILNRKEISLSK